MTPPLAHGLGEWLGLRTENVASQTRNSTPGNVKPGAGVRQDRRPFPKGARRQAAASNPGCPPKARVASRLRPPGPQVPEPAETQAMNKGDHCRTRGEVKKKAKKDESAKKGLSSAVPTFPGTTYRLSRRCRSSPTGSAHAREDHLTGSGSLPLPYPPLQQRLDQSTTNPHMT